MSIRTAPLLETRVSRHGKEDGERDKHHGFTGKMGRGIEDAGHEEREVEDGKQAGVGNQHAPRHGGTGRRAPPGEHRRPRGGSDAGGNTNQQIRRVPECVLRPILLFLYIYIGICFKKL